MAEIEETKLPEPIPRLGFAQFRQAFQNVQMKITKGALQSLNFIQYVSGWKWTNTSVEIYTGTFNLGGTLITVSDITLLQTSIDTLSTLGGGTVALVPGTYTATASITIPSNVTLDGNGSTIDFSGGAYQILIQGTNAYSTGTLAVNYASGSVTGTGTIWTAAMIGRSILIGDYWYEITARASNTAITISPVFRAPSVTGVSYVIATTVDNVVIKNTTLTNSSISALKFRYVNTIFMDSLFITNSAQGIDGDDSQGPFWEDSQVTNCVLGITFNNVPFGLFNGSNILDITGGTGLDLVGCSNMAISAMTIQNITGVGFKFTNCYNIGLINYAIVECSSHGIEFVSGNRDVNDSEGYIDSCGGDGIKFTATSDTSQVFGNSIINCTGYAINIANANCNNNVIGLNSYVNNTAGTINDSGTGTILVADDAVYGSGWNGDMSPPTKNAVYDKIETLPGLLTSGGPNTIATNDTFTADASTDFITSSSPHNLQNGDKVVLTTTGTLPAGLSLATGYFVRDKTSTTFKLSATPYDTAIDITGAGTGVHTWTNLQGSITLSFTAKTHLIIEAHILSATASTDVQMNFNGDGGTNYGTTTTLGGASQSTTNSGKKVTSMMSGGSTGQKFFCTSGLINVAANRKMGGYIGSGISNTGANGPDIVTGFFTWNNTADQISSVTVSADGVAGFGAGSLLYIFGSN